jgi:hypothetical protein
MRIQKAFKTAAAMAPWVFAMYVFYWLDSSGTWTAETAHRGKLSVIILGTGMVLSFLMQSHFSKQASR